MGRPKYVGIHSCYARREGVYVPGEGVTPRTAPGIAALILYDLYRGWGYNSRCEKIPMTRHLAVKRLAYMKTLARKHDPRDAPVVYQLVDYVLRNWSLPPGVYVELAGLRSRINEILGTLARIGVLPRIRAPVITRRRRITNMI